MKKILDACCGSKMFWFDKQNEHTVFMDNRTLDTNLCDGRKLVIKPDIIGDFRNMDFEDKTFYLVVFDPPHLKQAGESMRVLKPNGTLIFKWNEEQIKLKDILKVIEYKPLFGNKRAKTHWLVFMK